MRKNFIVKFMMVILSFVMSFTLVFVGDRAIEVEAAGDEITVDYTFVDADVSSAANKKGKVASFMFEGDFEVQLKNDTYDSTLRYFKTSDSGRYVVIRDKNVFTIKNNGENTLVSFKIIRTKAEEFKCSFTNANACSDSTVDKDLIFTPINPNEDIVISLTSEEYYVTGMAITYILPHTCEFTEIKYDETNHWIECECGAKQSNNPHVIEGNYSYDDNSHWYGCETCKYKSEEQEHNFDNGVTTAPSITDAKPGKTVYTCQTCNYEKTVYSYLDINDEKISIYYKNTLTYNGQEQSQELNVYYDDVELTEGVHYTLSGNNATNAGDYTLTIKGEGSFSGEKNFNYTIAKASLIVTVNDKEIVYGDNVPSYSVTYTGFVTGEDETVLSGELRFECDYVQYSNVGSYDLIASGLESSNYEITYVNGEVTVKPKEITGVEWSNLEFVYNGETHNPTASVNGLINEDDCAVELSAPQLNAGTYTSTVIGLTNSNYKLPKEVLETSYVINPKSILNATITLGDSLVYTGEELTQLIKTVVLDDVTLVENVDYTIEGNKATNAGDDYTLVILGKGNYTNSINKEFVIAKQKVELPTSNTGLVYTGATLTGVEASNLYNVENGSFINVGTYIAEVELRDTANYEWAESFDGKISWTIEKATHDMSGISFDDVTVTYDGVEHIISITGTLSEGVTVSYTNNKGTVVGTYNAVATFIYDTANYNTIADMNAVLTINKAKVELPEATTSFVYDGQAHTAVAAHNLYTVEGATETVVGSYEATVTLKDTDNYEWAEEFNGKVGWTITKATYDMSGIKFENVTVTYDGSEHKVEITGTLPEGVTVSYTNNKGTVVGTYNAVATFTYDTANYNTIADMNAVLTINKAKVELPEATSFIYDGTAKVAIAAHDLYTVEGATATVVGNYEATVTLNDTANYEWAEEFDGKVAWTITKATYDMSGIKFENVTVTYDGAEHKVEITGTLPEGVTVSYTTNKGTNAGTYNAVATFTYDTANYNTIEDMNAVLTINKATYDMSSVKFENVTVTYDGSEHEVVINGTLPEGVTVSYTTNKGTNVGTYNAVATFTYDTANYNTIEDMNAVLTINKTTYDMSSVKFENVTVTYDGSEHVIEITGTLPEGVTVAYTTNKGTNAGIYNAIAKFIGDANYNAIPDMNAVLTINKAKVELPEATTSFVYDGTAKVAVASHDLYTVTEGSATNAGSYEATVTLNDAANYEWAEEFNGKVAWTITKATHDMSGISFDDVTVTYDGVEHIISITGTLPEGVTVSYINNKATNAGVYNATATFTYDTANYNTIEDMNAVLTINKVKVALPETTTSFVYDGTAKVAVNTHDLYTVEGATETVVGSYEATVTLKDTDNYEWAEEFNGKVAWTIAKATHDMSGVKFENVTVVYNGTEHIISITGTLPEGVTVAYTNNKGTNAGTYNAVATFIYDTANYNTISEMTAVLTINKVKVALPEATTSFVYDGTAKVAVNTHDLYTVTEGSATNAGSYEATVTLNDTANYEWAEEFDGKVAWTITKATYDMSDIKFENVTVTYDGTEHKVEIAGTLPEGVTVAYTTNAGTNAGTYNAVATFTYDTANYNTIADMNAVLTINKIKVALPETTTSFVYDGTAKVAVNTHDLYTVEGATETVVGSYEATVTLKDTDNYEWAEEFNGKVAWTITKATYDMSGIKFENVTVTYNGTEHVIEITGTLPEGVTVAYTNNKGTNAGTYNATAKFTYDTANYNTISDMNAVLTINKFKVALPEPTTSFVYDGTAKVAVANHDLYTVTEGSATNAGSYEAVVTLKDTANYEWAETFNGKVSWAIAKATYDMSDITFENVTVVYNGTEYVIEITGTLPEGVTVSYTNNKGTNAGTYNAVATFTYDTANYNTIEDMNAVLTINTDEHSYVNPETNVEDVIVSTEDGNGIDPNKEVKIEMIEAEVSSESFDEFLDKKERVAIAYDVKLIQDGVEVQPDGILKIKILIPEELRDREFAIMHVHNGNETYMLEYEIEGDYVVFYTDKLSSFVFVYETGSILWLLIVFAVIAILEAGLLVFLLNKKKQFKLVNLAAAYPPFVFGMFLPAVQLVLFIILLVAIVALTTMDAIFGYELYGDKIKAFFKKDNDSKAVEQEVEVESTLDQEEIDSETEEEQMIVIEEDVEEPVAEESTEDDDEEDVMQVWDEETHSFTIIRIIKSFTARLIQSKDEDKDYYDIIKNELLSYKKVKSRISFKHEAFKFGKDNVARLRFRGKTLCLYLALNPADYENTKYKIEDMSAIFNSSDVPTMYRITLPRRADYAKELIYDLMKKLGAERMDIDYKEYSKEYPYEDNEALLEKGLIKKSVKVIGNGTSTKTLDNPVNIVKKVSASEVNDLITDEQVIELIEQSTRIADKTKKTIINIDTLSQYFNENETVTLEEIKKRIPNVEKKATYYKVLARGTLDKPLIVDADDFSIEAEKMIIVTGGKVLVSKAK